MLYTGVEDYLLHSLAAAACADPIPPRGGYIHTHTSTVEGSVVRYQCYPGLSPRGVTVLESICGEDGNWRPNPADLTCRAAGNVQFSSRIEYAYSAKDPVFRIQREIKLWRK